MCACESHSLLQFPIAGLEFGGDRSRELALEHVIEDFFGLLELWSSRRRLKSDVDFDVRQKSAPCEVRRADVYDSVRSAFKNVQLRVENLWPKRMVYSALRPMGL